MLLDHFFPRAQSLSHQSHQAGRLYANSGADVNPSAVLLWPLQRVVWLMSLCWVVVFDSVLSNTAVEYCSGGRLLCHCDCIVFVWYKWQFVYILSRFSPNLKTSNWLYGKISNDNQILCPSFHFKTKQIYSLPHSALFLRSRLCGRLSPVNTCMKPSSTDRTLAVSFKCFKSESPRG